MFFQQGLHSLRQLPIVNEQPVIVPMLKRSLANDCQDSSAVLRRGHLSADFRRQGSNSVTGYWHQASRNHVAPRHVLVRNHDLNWFAVEEDPGQAGNAC